MRASASRSPVPSPPLLHVPAREGGKSWQSQALLSPAAKLGRISSAWTSIMAVSSSALHCLHHWAPCTGHSMHCHSVHSSGQSELSATLGLSLPRAKTQLWSPESTLLPLLYAPASRWASGHVSKRERHQHPHPVRSTTSALERRKSP